MSNSAPDACASAEEPPDPSIECAERRLRLLKELSEIGMELARTLRPGAKADEPSTDKAPGKDPAAAFAPLSRAIRLTLALEAKTCQELRDLKAGVVRVREEERAQAAARAGVAAARDREARIERVRDLVLCVAETEVPDMDAFDTLYEDLDEELTDDDGGFGYAERPLRQSVERLCVTFGLNPDWSRWTDEGWNLDDVPLRPGFTAFRLCATRRGPETPILQWRRQAAHDLE
jgi:hypothetical protein